MEGQWALVQVVVILRFIHCRAVDPPQNLTVADPDLLGNLEIRWSPSEEHVGAKGQCSVLYELHYFDSYSSRWTSIRTSQTSFRAQFDMTQDVRVCVYSVISGECAGGSRAKSTNCTAATLKPDRTGLEGIKDLTCVYHNMEHVVCRWRRSSKMPAQAREALHYWHRELARAKECPRYIISDGLRSGCNFSGTELPTFSNVILCVNVSSARPVRTLYSLLQIQNIVKPNAITEVRVEAGADGLLRVLWDGPTGKIPPHCLQFEVQERRESPDSKQTLILSTETALTLTLPDDGSSCLSVRSMLNKYCANSGLWADWSPAVCYPERKVSTSGWGLSSEHMHIALAAVAALVLGLCACAAFAWLRLQQVRARDSSLSSLFDKRAERFPPKPLHF